LLFSEVVLDLLARWHENSEGVELNQWERRLAVLAMLPEIRPELWRCVRQPLERC